MVPSDNIEVRSIVGRFLEHARVFYFGDETAAKLYLGSADLMTRNLDVRVEALTPLYDPKIKSEMVSYLELQWSDNQNSRVIDSSLSNKMYTDDLPECDSQIELYQQLK
jgi:polyphosphate kinase